MTEKERNDFLKILEHKRQEVAGSETAARDFLKKVGIITNEEKLSEHYQHLCIPQDQD